MGRSTVKQRGTMTWQKGQVHEVGSFWLGHTSAKQRGTARVSRILQRGSEGEGLEMGCDGQGSSLPH